jgi:uncharacterized repeat protein (TIGR01451 family)
MESWKLGSPEAWKQGMNESMWWPRSSGTRRKPLALVALWAGLASVGLSQMAVAEVILATRVEKLESSATVCEPGAAGEPDAAGAQREAVESVIPGDVLRYTIVFENRSGQDAVAGSIVITNPLPAGTTYLAGSAAGRSTLISFSADGEHFDDPAALTVADPAGSRPAEPQDYRSIRWRFQPRLRPGESSEVSFDVQVR